MEPIRVLTGTPAVFLVDAAAWEKDLHENKKTYPHHEDADMGLVNIIKFFFAKLGTPRR